MAKKGIKGGKPGTQKPMEGSKKPTPKPTSTGGTGKLR